MWIGTSLPPDPPRAALALAAAGCLVVGVVLNLRGRTLARTVLPLAAAAAGAAFSPWIVQHIPYKNVWVVGTAAALTLGLLAFVFCRVFWAAVLGAGVAAVAVVVLIRTGPAPAEPPAWPETAPAAFAGWCAAASAYAADWVRMLFAERLLAAMLATGVPVLGCVAVELLLPRTMLTISTAAVGGLLVVGGALGLAWAVSRDWAAALVDRPMILAIAAGVVVLAGFVVQVTGVLRARARAKREEREREQEKSESGVEDEKMRT